MSDNNLMKYSVVVGVGALISAGITYLQQQDQYKRTHNMAYPYPRVYRGDVVDNLHGTQVADPYRWLEDPDSPATTRWVESQNKLTSSFLNQCADRAKINQKITHWYNYERFSCPWKRGKYYFFYKNNGLQNQSVLHYQEGLEGKEQVLLDPNTFSSDGTAALAFVSISDCGKYAAYGVSNSGSDWQTIYIKNIETGDTYSDKLEWVKFTYAIWSTDSIGFFYSRYPTPAAFQNGADENYKRGSETESNVNQALYYHKIGTSQSTDIKVYSNPQYPKWMFGSDTTDDGRYLLISVSESTDNVNQLYYADMKHLHEIRDDNIPVVKLIDNFEAEYSYICNIDSLFYFKTNLNAPRGRVIAIDFAHPENWREIIPEASGVLNSVYILNQDQLLLVYMQDVKEIIKQYDLQGRHVKDFDMPTFGTLELTGRKQQTEFFFKLISFLSPGTIYRYDFNTASASVFREMKPVDFDQSLFKVEQVFYTSKDGTKVPMYIISKKDMPLDGRRPALLYGYGGFNISLLPSFSVARLVWVLHYCGIVAIPNLRGGGEYGEEWHKAGVLNKKQNVFDDFHAAAEFLIQNNYTSSDKLCISGGSNGGLLVGAAINQRPDLYGAAIAAVGVLDMLRFHKFTIGYAWCSEYGCADEKEHFDFLYKYSPLHNIKKGKQYPAVMLTTADHDDRVVPLHSYKFIAELQHKLANEPYQKNPLLIRIETKAGHGAGKPLTKVVEEQSDMYGFMAKVLNASWNDV